MYIIASTRFNADTWKQNKEWRKKNCWCGCVYGSPKQTALSHATDVLMFVLEMDNSKNKIRGVGLIRNRHVTKEHHKIYTDRNYNRYTYKGEYRVSRKQMTREEKQIIRAFDILLFKGSRHLKRGQGIIALPTRFVNTTYVDLRMFFRTMFKKRYGNVAEEKETKLENK